MTFPALPTYALMFASAAMAAEFEMFDADLYSFRFHDRPPIQPKDK